MNKSGVIIAIVILFSSYSSEATAQKSSFYVIPNAMIESTFIPSYIDDENYEDPFDFMIDAFLSFGVEVGKEFEVGYIGVQGRVGNSLTEKRLEENGGFNGEAELHSLWAVGVNYRRQFWENKQERKFRLEFGNRIEVDLYNINGIRVFENEDYTYRVEDFNILTPGAESGLFLNFGSRNNGEKSKVAFTWEPIGLRVTTKGLGLNLQRVGLLITF